MEEQGISVRAFAKRLAQAKDPDPDHDAIEKQRTNVGRWRKGTVPDAENAKLAAEALDVSHTELLQAPVTAAEYERLIEAVKQVPLNVLPADAAAEIRAAIDLFAELDRLAG